MSYIFVLLPAEKEMCYNYIDCTVATKEHVLSNDKTTQKIWHVYILLHECNVYQSNP